MSKVTCFLGYPKGKSEGISIHSVEKGKLSNAWFEGKNETGKAKTGQEVKKGDTKRKNPAWPFNENFQVRVRYCREEEHQLQRRPKAPNLKDSTSSSGLTPRIKIGPTSKRPLRRLKGIKWI
ncbi:hypothetical protein PV326_011088 [Microctonus aethiopoides]|nr:hypothetical protein PV326_011088 [Microctonus aethiopoides]